MICTFSHIAFGLVSRNLCIHGSWLSFAGLRAGLPFGIRLRARAKDSRTGEISGLSALLPTQLGSLKDHRGRQVQLAIIFYVYLQLISQKLQNTFLSTLANKHSFILTKYTNRVTFKILHLFMFPYSLVISPLYILSKYSHCHQLNNKVDKENMVGAVPQRLP